MTSHSESSWFVRENEDLESLPSRFHFDSGRRRFSHCSFSFEYHEHVKLSWEAVCSYKVSLYKWAKIGSSKIFPRRGCLGHRENADSISQCSTSWLIIAAICTGQRSVFFLSATWGVKIPQPNNRRKSSRLIADGWQRKMLMEAREMWKVREVKDLNFLLCQWQ